MSVFVDVFDSLSEPIKKNFLQHIEAEKKNHDRPVRRVCELCIKYLDYGELFYSKMEEGIEEINRIKTGTEPFHMLLLAIMHDPLDENEVVIQNLEQFKKASPHIPFYQELDDFITIARFMSLNETSLMEHAGEIIVERYVNEQNVAEVISNLYLKEESEVHIPMFLKLLTQAKQRFPESNSVDSLSAFLNIKRKNYTEALASFLTIKDRLERNPSHPYFNHNMATTWDQIAGCYMKMEDAEKTLESCETALMYDEKSGDFSVGAPIYHKKAEALMLKGQKEEALEITKRLLKENEEDEVAKELQQKAQE